MNPEFAKVLPQVVTGVSALGGAFGVAAMNHRAQKHQRAQEEATASRASTKATVRELLEAVANLQQTLEQMAPLWNSWGPKLLMMGSAALEGMATSSVSTLHGWAHAGRVAVDYGDRETATVVPAIAAAVARVHTAAIEAALLPAGSVRDASLDLSAAASEVARAYAVDSLWRPTKAKKGREAAAAALTDAVRVLLDAIALADAATVRDRWWRRIRHAIRPYRQPAARAVVLAREEPST
jgi:hypothetical protein